MRTRLQQKVSPRSFEALLEDVSVGCCLSGTRDKWGQTLCCPWPEPAFKLGHSSTPLISLLAHLSALHPCTWPGVDRGPGPRRTGSKVTLSPVPHITGMGDDLADAGCCRLGTSAGGLHHPGTHVPGRSQGYTSATELRDVCVSPLQLAPPKVL